MSSAVLAAILVVLALAGVVEALRCLADHLLVSALIYAVIGAGLAALAGKAAIDAI
jgi:hypothetical protein